MKHANGSFLLTSMKIVPALVTAALGSIAFLALADDLPKSGSISIHSGYHVNGESINVAEKIAQGHGKNLGISFNDKGSGPLHLGPTDCFYTFSAAVEAVKVKGYCTFGDPDGDRIFTDFKGAYDSEGYVQGMHDVDGGTGKYSGIKGSMTFKCKQMGGNSELACTQTLTYRLP